MTFETSLLFRPAALTRTSTSPAAGSGSGASTSDSWARSPVFSKRRAFILLPDPRGHLQQAAELALLQVLGHRIGQHVELGHGRAAEAALRAKPQLLDRDMLACLVDPPPERVGRFDFRPLGADHAEERDLPLAQVLERREIAGARRVVLEQVGVDLEAPEQALGDRRITAVAHPQALHVAAAHVQRD